MPVHFYRLIIARFLFVIAMQMQAVVLGWQMYLLTKSAFYLGFIGLAEAVPALGLALFAGYFVDRRNPLPVFYKVILLTIFSAALMFFGQQEEGFLTPNQKVLALFISSFCTGISRAFLHPVIYTLVPAVVPRGLLPKAAAVSASTMQTARITGPALGGLLFGFFGIRGCALIICLLLSCSLICALFIKLTNPPKREKKGGMSFREELLAGAKYVYRHPILFPALSLDMVSMFLGGVTALLPIFASEILRCGSWGLGILRAAPALGAAIMSFFLIFIPLKQEAGRLMLSAVVGFGLSIIGFALSTSLPLSLLCLGFSGAFDSISVVIRSSAIQLASPDHMRGRVSSVNSIFVGSSNELGEFESGTLAGLMGAVNAALFGGIACIITVGVMALSFPKLRKLDLSKL